MGECLIPGGSAGKPCLLANMAVPVFNGVRVGHAILFFMVTKELIREIRREFSLDWNDQIRGASFCTVQK